MARSIFQEVGSFDDTSSGVVVLSGECELMPRAGFKPSVQGLERRDLMATAVANLVATPSLLTPPNNRFVRVHVTGNVLENRRKVIPDVDFTVVDEYRRIEPSGPVKLTRVTSTVYSFKFSVVLQAKRAPQDTAGRQYYVIVGTSDMDNSQGLIVPVLVPFNNVKAGRAMVSSSARGGSRIRV